MTALGDRLVILLIGITGLVGLFAFWSGYLEALVAEPFEWVIRGGFVLLFFVIVGYIWWRSRMTDPAK